DQVGLVELEAGLVAVGVKLEAGDPGDDGAGRLEAKGAIEIGGDDQTARGRSELLGAVGDRHGDAAAGEEGGGGGDRAAGAANGGGRAHPFLPRVSHLPRKLIQKDMPIRRRSSAKDWRRT